MEFFFLLLIFVFLCLFSTLRKLRSAISNSTSRMSLLLTLYRFDVISCLMLTLPCRRGGMNAVSEGYCYCVNQ